MTHVVARIAKAMGMSGHQLAVLSHQTKAIKHRGVKKGAQSGREPKGKYLELQAWNNIGTAKTQHGRGKGKGGLGVRTMS